MPPSPLTLLRKAQPGSLTLEEVARRMKRAGVVRYITGISKFERGEIITPEDDFLRAYAAALGVTVGAVAREFARTARWRARYVRPLEASNTREKSPLTCRSAQG
jgi:transcriptional regulator with XRE-family HTH domain